MRQERGEGEKQRDRRDSEKESSLHPLIVPLYVPVDFITQASSEISLVCSWKHVVKSVCSSFYVSTAAWSASVCFNEISGYQRLDQWSSGLLCSEKVLKITRWVNGSYGSLFTNVYRSKPEGHFHFSNIFKFTVFNQIPDAKCINETPEMLNE